MASDDDGWHSDSVLGNKGGWLVMMMANWHSDSVLGNNRGGRDCGRQNTSVFLKRQLISSSLLLQCQSTDPLLTGIHAPSVNPDGKILK